MSHVLVQVQLGKNFGLPGFSTGLTPTGNSLTLKNQMQEKGNRLQNRENFQQLGNAQNHTKDFVFMKLECSTLATYTTRDKSTDLQSRPNSY